MKTADGKITQRGSNSWKGSNNVSKIVKKWLLEGELHFRSWFSHSFIHSFTIFIEPCSPPWTKPRSLPCEASSLAGGDWQLATNIQVRNDIIVEDKHYGQKPSWCRLKGWRAGYGTEQGAQGWLHREGESWVKPEGGKDGSQAEVWGQKEQRSSGKFAYTTTASETAGRLCPRQAGQQRRDEEKTGLHEPLQGLWAFPLSEMQRHCRGLSPKKAWHDLTYFKWITLDSVSRIYCRKVRVEAERPIRFFQ